MNSPTGKAPRDKLEKTGTRHSHSIRFSDSEWYLVEKAASRHGIPTGEFVRSGALSAAEGYSSVPPETNLSTGHAALIEAIYRAVYLLATISREKLIEAGREEDIEGIVVEARNAMVHTMKADLE
ncbi:MAG: hypothetical protein F4206_14840 [Gammaproteobacteria bacterium]|nr:hypothetical protein [Gammaproteobacteria bacterium]MYG67984.1 hypothetical protein [Gammaproteobacteria bacterium]